MTDIKTIAPLRNVGLFSGLVDRVVNRTKGLPGLGIFYGPSGYGKTFSAVYAANKHRAYFLEVGDSWTKKRFLEGLAVEVGMPTNGTISAIVDRIIAALEDDPRPIIIDEADIILARGYIEQVREFHNKAGVPIILIGEELFPSKLRAVSERVANRVLDPVAAQPSDMEDARHLAGLYCAGIQVAGDLLECIVDKSGARARRIAVNLDRVRERATNEGRDAVDLAWWGSEPFFTGRVPGRRALAD